MHSIRYHTHLLLNYIMVITSFLIPPKILIARGAEPSRQASLGSRQP